MTINEARKICRDFYDLTNPTEDDEFKRKLYYNLGGKKKAVITDYLYHYRTSVENSKSKKFMNGELDSPN